MGKDQTKSARNVHRSIMKPLDTNNMASDFWSDIVDFREMVLGSIQAIWSGANGTDATLEIYVSQFDDDLSFAPFPGSLCSIDICNSRLWNLSLIGFRYARVKYTANSVTQGNMQITAIAKLSR